MELDRTFEEQTLVAAADERRATALAGRERLVELVMGATFAIACAVLIAVWPPASGDLLLGPALGSAVVLAVAMHVRFYVGAGYTVPTQLAFIPLAFSLPPSLLPPAVAVVLVASSIVDVVRGVLPASRLLLAPGNAWFAVGPAAVLAAAGAPSATEASAALVVGMLAAQIATDLVASGAREMLHGSYSWRAQVAELWIFAVDAALTPVAFLAAVIAVQRPWATLSAIPLIGILAFFARERRARLENLTELNAAYRGTALVLGDVVEADDGYTGEHCRDVVELALQMGSRLDLSAARMRNLEFGALLHDVGKVAIPKTIINKPEALDSDEWELMKTHTIEGQRMLDRVGGFMRDVGVIVRSHHERWDGGGYPDGIAEAAIPIEARIISCCDTWNAMTTDRAYRKALPVAVAAAEIRAVAGSQLDPQLAPLLLEVVRATEPDPQHFPAAVATPHLATV